MAEDQAARSPRRSCSRKQKGDGRETQVLSGTIRDPTYLDMRG